MIRTGATGLALLSAAALTACSGHSYQPPARTSQIVAEEARVAALIERHESGLFDDRPGTCAVRVLGMQADSTYAWADCTYPPNGGLSAPFRVDGHAVRNAQDGSLYSDSIKEMFPADLAQAVLDDPERLRPAAS